MDSDFVLLVPIIIQILMIYMYMYVEHIVMYG